MVSTISVFHCTLMFTNPAQLFHDFRKVEWFVQRWMICNYYVECILTLLVDLYTIYDTFNALYYVEWFVLSWIICNYNVESVLTTLKDLCSCWMIWTVQWNFPLENIPPKVVSELSLPWKSQQWPLTHQKIPLWKFVRWKLLCNK